MSFPSFVSALPVLVFFVWVRPLRVPGEHGVLWTGWGGSDVSGSIAGGGNDTGVSLDSTV